jgi:hypothetical protein
MKFDLSYFFLKSENKNFPLFTLLILIGFPGLVIFGQPAIDDFPPRYFTGPPEFTVPPGIDPDNELLQKGYLDVRLYGAIPDDNEDDTEEIQQAIFDSYIYSYAVYFPTGTYNVSNTLNCMAPTIINGTENTMSSIRPAHVLIGSTQGPRPVIKLDDNCPGFQDASAIQYTTAGKNPEIVTQYTSLKAVINFWRQGRDGGGAVDRELNTGNINFNQTIRGIDIDCGTGNPGAVGLWMQGAEGTTCQDVKITAYGAFAGMYDMMGSGGSPTNLEIYGGRYGIYAFKMRPIPVVTGLKLHDQTEACFYVGDFTPVTFVGFDFKIQSGPVFKFKTPWHPCQGNLSLIDGRIELTDGNESHSIIENGAGDNKERILYIKNVFVKGAGTVVHNTVSNRRLIVDDHTQWTKIEEYQYNRNYSIPVKLIDGVLSSKSTWYNGELTDNSVTASLHESPPEDLISKHLWEEGFACFDYDTLNILNVMDFGAIPDDGADDAEAFNKAIDSAQNCTPVKRVFIPRGHFKINNTIHLKKDVELFGVARHLTILQPKGWIETNETPVISSANDAGATSKMANFKIELYYSQYQIYAINWEAGPESVVKDVWVYWIGWSETGVTDDNKALRRIQIRNNGGGRWYNHLGMSGNGSRNHLSRHVLIEGTSNPLTFYGFHNQYLETLDGPMSEITGASNVTLYSLKSETASERKNLPEGQWSISVLIKNSKNIGLYGMSGIAQTETGKGLVEVENSNEVTIANMGTWLTNNEYPLNSWYLVKEYFNGEPEGILIELKVMGLYKGGYTRKLYNIPENHPGLVPAMEAAQSDTTVLKAYINIAEGDFVESSSFQSMLNRDLEIHVKGNKADNTIIMGSMNSSPKPGIRLVNAENSGTGKLSLEFRDLSFRNFGFNESQYHEGGVFFAGDSPVSFKFLNCNFSNNTAAAGSILSFGHPDSEIILDNCFFGSNTFGPGDEGKLKGILDIEAGNLIVKNSLFMSNMINPPADGMNEFSLGSYASIISAGNRMGAASVTLQDNVFIDNKNFSDTYNQGVISAYQWEENISPVSIQMDNNIMTGNIDIEKQSESDIKLENASISLSGSGNVINSLLINNESQKAYEGIQVRPEMGYTGDTIEFIMDGNLPELFADEKGIFYVKYEFIDPPTLPSVSTKIITSITDSSAISGGNISSNGGTVIIACGVAWSTLPSPTIENDTTVDIIESGSFTSHLNNLEPATRYYMRAYAINEVGVAYGSETSFTTKEDPTTGIVQSYATPEFYTAQGSLIGKKLQSGQILYLYSITGSLIHKQQIRSNHIELALNKGLYIVHYKNFIKKIILLN